MLGDREFRKNKLSSIKGLQTKIQCRVFPGYAERFLNSDSIFLNQLFNDMFPRKRQNIRPTVENFSQKLCFWNYFNQFLLCAYY